MAADVHAVASGIIPLFPPCPYALLLSISLSFLYIFCYFFIKVVTSANLFSPAFYFFFDN